MGHPDNLTNILAHSSRMSSCVLCEALCTHCCSDSCRTLCQPTTTLPTRCIQLPRRKYTHTHTYMLQGANDADDGGVSVPDTRAATGVGAALHHCCWCVCVCVW